MYQALLNIMMYRDAPTDQPKDNSRIINQLLLPFRTPIRPTLLSRLLHRSPPSIKLCNNLRIDTIKLLLWENT